MTNKKNIILALCTMLIIAFANSCKNKSEGQSPTSVVEAMAKESEKLDLKLLTPFLCNDDKTAVDKINTVASIAAGVSGKTASVLIKEVLAKTEVLNFKEAKFTNEKISGDMASVDITSKVAKERTIKLKKEEGNWKIYLGLKDLINKEFGKLNIGSILPKLNKVKDALQKEKKTTELAQ